MSILDYIKNIKEKVNWPRSELVGSNAEDEKKLREETMAGDRHEIVKEILDCSVRDIRIGKSHYKVEDVTYNGTKNVSDGHHGFDPDDITRREITVTNKDGTKIGIKFEQGEELLTPCISFFAKDERVSEMYLGTTPSIISSIREVPTIDLSKELFDKPKQESFETSSPKKPFNFMNTNDLLYDMEHTFHDSKQAQDLANLLKTFVVVTPEERSSYKAYASSVDDYKEEKKRQAEEQRRAEAEEKRKKKEENRKEKEEYRKHRAEIENVYKAQFSKWKRNSLFKR